MFCIPDYVEQTHGITLNQQQKKAVLTHDRHTLLLAVPGSGKTTVLVSHMAHLILNQNVAPDRMLTFTFGRESAKDMKMRFVSLFGAVISQVPGFSTIHSFCYSLLQQYAKRYRRNMPTLLQGETSKILRDIGRKVNEEYLSDDQLEQLMNEIGLAKNLMLSPHEFQAHNISTENFAQIHQCYQQIKRDNLWMDFDDMLQFALDILHKVPNMRSQIAKAYDYLNIDEAQDISKLQHEIVRLLSDTMTLFVVGDEDQSIYTFRGAFPDGLTSFAQAYPAAQVLKIEQNYRSHSDLVSLANQFIQGNQNRYPKQMVSSNQRKDSVFEVQMKDYRQQYETILSEIKHTDGQLAVLYRNNESAIPLIDLLSQEGISFYIKQHTMRFFSSATVKDIIAFLRLSKNPKDLSAFAQIYYKWMCPKAVFLFVKSNLDRYDSVFTAALDCPDLPFYHHKRLLQYHARLHRLSHKNSVQAIDDILYHLDYAQALERKPESSWMLKISILKTLANSCRTIDLFLDKLACLKQQLVNMQGQQQNARVTLSSIHSSKGLEFDTVILLDFIDGIMPSEDAIRDMSDGRLAAIEDEARLFYVAVTRAKSKLIIPTAKYCNEGHAVKSQLITRFLQQSTQKNKDHTR